MRGKKDLQQQQQKISSHGEKILVHLGLFTVFFFWRLIFAIFYHFREIRHGPTRLHGGLLARGPVHGGAQQGGQLGRRVQFNVNIRHDKCKFVKWQVLLGENLFHAVGQ